MYKLTVITARKTEVEKILDVLGLKPEIPEKLPTRLDTNTSTIRIQEV